MTKDPKPRFADVLEAKQWRGKVRVQERRNTAGWVEYCAQYRLNWWLSFDWLPVENKGVTAGYFVFYKFEDAKTAAQLKWNAASTEHKEANRTRFGAWRKIWP